VIGSAFRERVSLRARKAGADLDLAALEWFEAYYRLLGQWNRKINLTALPLKDSPPRTIDRLLIEPLIASRFVDNSPLSWFDLGSGGGSPAIPLKVVRPQIRLTMVESRTRKAAFLREAARTLGLADTTVLDVRVEELGKAGYGGTVDLVTVRAVKTDELLLRSACSLLRSGGRLVLFRPAADHPSYPSMTSELETVEQATLPSRGGVLHVLAKKSRS
jgi:16S rRNA (guanine527-N7)-methyltransferase